MIDIERILKKLEKLEIPSAKLLEFWSLLNEIQRNQYNAIHRQVSETIEGLIADDCKKIKDFLKEFEKEKYDFKDVIDDEQKNVDDLIGNVQVALGWKYVLDEILNFIRVVTQFSDFITVVTKFYWGW